LTNRIHPTAIIGTGVELGVHNIIGPYSVILGPCRIGDGNWIGPHVTIGAPAEDRDGPHPAAWEGELAGQGVTIGNGNRIREHVSITQGTRRSTTVGDGCYLLANSHLGHDALVDDGVTIACAVQLGGHSHIWAHANLGLGAVVHQHCHVGPGAMIGMGAAVRREVSPFTVVVGVPARVTGVNVVGLRRLGCDPAMVERIEPDMRDPAALLGYGLPEDIHTLVKAWADR
jgi:UDP-N-acetylglucosamine acyltransferase